MKHCPEKWKIGNVKYINTKSKKGGKFFFVFFFLISNQSFGVACMAT